MRCSLVLILSFLSFRSFAQVDTTAIYNPSASFGSLDLRLAKSPEHYYYLKEGTTFSFRSKEGVPTGTFRDMTAWDSRTYTEGHLRERTSSSDEFVMNYRLLSPQGYQKNYEQGYPLVILLHGLLERGNCAEGKCYHGTRHYDPAVNQPAAPSDESDEMLNNDYNLVHGGFNYLEASLLNGVTLPDDAAAPPRGFPGFVVFPQNLNGWEDGAVEDAIRIVRLLVKKYNIDEDRIYINGVSHGGHGAYKAMMRAPWLFAAGVLFSAADDAGVISQNQINDIPLWLFQGGKDLKPTQAQTERYVQQLRGKGADIRYTLYPELGHGTWNKAFAEPDFFTWMLRHRKNDIHVYAARPIICKTSSQGAELSLPAGHPACEWELDGNTLTDNSRVIYARLAGVYRGRFLNVRGDGSQEWSAWSKRVMVSEKDPGQSAVGVVGTRFMPDLNNESEVTITSLSEHNFYYWYKDNNIRLGFEDSSRTVTLKSTIGSGRYFMKAADYDKCFTNTSTPEAVYFNDTAPYNLEAPGDLAVTAISPSQTQVRWSGVPSAATHLEVWRRESHNAGTTGKWILTSHIKADAAEYIDNELKPSRNYEYRIRAVGINGRSNYFPDLKTTPVMVSMPADSQPPSAPLLTELTMTGVSSLSVKWKPGSDNSAIERYIIYFNSDTVHARAIDSLITINDIEINQLYNFHAVAVDVAGNESNSSNELTIHTIVNGFFYQHSTGAWETLSEIDWTLAEFKGVVPDITLEPKTQQDFFNFRFDGFLQIRDKGIYQFRISSDDGSSFSLGDSLLVINDGIHNLTSTTSPIQLLESGHHRIRIDFFDYDHSDSLLLEYKGPDSNGEWTKIPAHAFTSNIITEIAVNNQAETQITVFPNPTTSENINLSANGSSDAVSLSLMSVTGQILYQQMIENPADADRHELKPDNPLQPGLYFLVARQKDHTQIIRVIIK